MQTNEEIKEKVIKEWGEVFGHQYQLILNSKALDFLLEKIDKLLSLQKQQMIEKGEGLKKEVKFPDNTAYEVARHNKIITDYQNLIKE